MCFCEEKVTCLYLDPEEQIDRISMVGSFCGCMMGLQAFRGWAAVGRDGLGSVQEESGWRDEGFGFLLKLAHSERKELKDPFLKI